MQANTLKIDSLTGRVPMLARCGITIIKFVTMSSCREGITEYVRLGCPYRMNAQKFPFPILPCCENKLCKGVSGIYNAKP
jgi:hypothetical protein